MLLNKYFDLVILECRWDFVILISLSDVNVIGLWIIFWVVKSRLLGDL